jgi:CubicO group peptidase (beta-lactamase class C family)
MKIIVAILTAWITTSVSGAQPIDTVKQLDALFSRWNNATPGAAIAIQRGENLIYNKAFGLSDLEHNVPNTPETIFESGSVAKQFTAAAILMLAVDGQLNLQDDIRKFIPELPVYDAPITIQHLLNHTSGLKDWGSVGALTGWPRTTRVYTQALALDIMSKQTSLNFKPGSKYSYSNSNYSLLATIVERVSKKSLAQFTDSVFFKPLGMHHTQWRDNFREVVPDRAIAYSGHENNYQQLMPFENIHGHGGLLTTTGDLLKWNKLLETKTIVGETVAQWRIQKGKVNDGTEISYAAGLFIGEVNEYLEISHSGATAGYRAWLAYYPQKKLSIAILSNDAGMGGIWQQVAAIFFGPPVQSVPVKPTHFITLGEDQKKAWSGVYKLVDGFDVIRLEYHDTKLISNGHELSALHQDTLYHDHFYWIRTSPKEIILKTPRGTGTYERMEDADLKTESLRQFTGLYFSAEADATYRITLAEKSLTLHIMPGLVQVLTPLYRNGFRYEDFNHYEFKKDKKGKVIGLEVSTGRALNVPFKKIY